ERGGADRGGARGVGGEGAQGRVSGGPDGAAEGGEGRVDGEAAGQAGGRVDRGEARGGRAREDGVGPDHRPIVEVEHAGGDRGGGDVGRAHGVGRERAQGAARQTADRAGEGGGRGVDGEGTGEGGLAVEGGLEADQGGAGEGGQGVRRQRRGPGEIEGGGLHGAAGEGRGVVDREDAQGAQGGRARGVGA